jgi:hypothetical protein
MLKITKDVEDSEIVCPDNFDDLQDELASGAHDATTDLMRRVGLCECDEESCTCEYDWTSLVELSFDRVHDALHAGLRGDPFHV